MNEETRTSEGLVEVRAFLRDGDLVALPVGNMAALFRVVHDQLNGETDFEYEGIASITGQQDVVRRVR